MRKVAVLMICAIILGATSMAVAQQKSVTVEGSFSGALCAFYGNQCPAHLTEAHIAVEPDFVLQDAGGKNHLVINLPRSVKVRHLKMKVRVTGHTNSQGALLAESLEVYENNRYVEAWTLAQQMEENKKNLWSGSIK